MADPHLRSPFEAYGPTLIELGKRNEAIVVLNAEKTLSPSIEAFSSLFPERYFPVGVSEQDLVLTAAGLALESRRVFVTSAAPLLVERAYEQIRSAIAISSLPVCLVATHGGITTGEGAPQQMIEDLALMRVLPNMSVLVPCDYVSAAVLIRKVIEGESPAYLRLGMLRHAFLYKEEDDDFHPGGGRILLEGKSVTIIACGIMVHEALSAAKILAQQGIDAEVIDCYSIKPFPEQLVLSSVHRTGCCVVAEEHNRMGGLCGAVAECLVQRFPIPVRFVALDDQFGQSGSACELQEYYGLTYQSIVGAAAQVWPLRRRS